MKLSILLFSSIALLFSVAQASKFWDDFYVNFGHWNVNYPGRDVGNIVQLQLDDTSGSGFRSNFPYLYGQFSMRVKLAGGHSAGTVTSFYMASVYEQWYELDFEFLGNVTGEPYILQTNVFVEGDGYREQGIYLWFDPTADYHDYGFVWNHELILFTVDSRVIRVFHNAKDLGIPYFEYQPMYIYSSIWNGEEWATCGGTVKPDWTQQPFVASYTAFNVSNACSVQSLSGEQAMNSCYEKLHQSSYGQDPNLALSQKQIDDLRWIRKNYLIYDYCKTTVHEKIEGVKSEFKLAPECSRNWP
ncbi:xyloglucan:xyloglucosyl transferase [Marchantia polymorpha subsp. ruderalis]|uniref:Xyloglucan endotransglucosylase/hydrolase n=2 Tax=Marchantia polymorpha TaxID=3197 RepID=A0A176W7Y8_MARPO|nr:hypothetical protein AXG93_2175s1660 [Marchantia polymorpha subsp. ruderalis]PTQ35474.1 hypothetical protein MARPO_0071s0085 [Marchantia polymorpha]BBN11848.1 hypothetical protein Mp_5g15250 [Marchantia polymorpha subsp. ruderalis]|eukprot:PTQ35474.1 hypothetical protein MARPO_0071s0085 [Marchantia polymorpha]